MNQWNESMELEFSSRGPIPKSETGALAFLNKHPEHDGRGILIAILDTGVDPGAPGMQETSTGLPKIIDIIDTSGSGDVDTSFVQTADANGCIMGLTGRTLMIPETWVNPSGKYNIGVKNLTTVLPKPLLQRLARENKESSWDSQHKMKTAVTVGKLEAFDVARQSNLQLADRFYRDDLSAQIELLAKLEKSYADPGPTVDCVVFHDGDKWRACVDTSLCGDLSECELLYNYRESHEYSCNNRTSILDFSVNIYENGTLLSIIANRASHGTHVAAIAAGYFPNEPEMNGIAPGAQILAIKIGDSRLNTKGTGPGLIRAMSEVIKYGCDLANLSLGDSGHWPNSGKICSAIDEAVNKHGLIFLGGTGSDGPCVSTVGSPGGTTESIIGIGAWFSPEMMIAEYSHAEKLPANSYTWSSRGPCVNGDLGVCLVAPCGANATGSLQCHRCCAAAPSLQGTPFLNGTSLATPNACGTIALLLSGLKAENVMYTPHSVRRTLENTALKQENIELFAQGYGLIQVTEAFESLTTHGMITTDKVKFALSAPDGGKGYYSRGSRATNLTPRSFSVSVEPRFHPGTDIREKVEFECPMTICSTASWVESPSHFKCVNMPRSLTVKVDHCGLPAGIHYAEIQGFDVKLAKRGPLFRFPVTVIMPEKFLENGNYQLKMDPTEFKCGQIHKRFIMIPDGATWGEISIQNHTPEQSCQFVFHCLQLLPQLSFRMREYRRSFLLDEHKVTEIAFPVHPGVTAELCLARWWSGMGSVAVSYRVQFHGITLSHGSSIFMQACSGIHRVEVKSLRKVEINPEVTLKYMTKSVRPSSHAIRPLGSRDIFLDERPIYEIISTYNFTQHKSAKVMPYCPLFSEILFENEFNSYIWMLFNSSMQCVACGGGVSNKATRYQVELEKGYYTLKMQVSHESKEMLERLKDVPFCFKQKLSSSITIDIYSQHKEALIAGSKAGRSFLTPEEPKALYFTSPADEKLLKHISPGQVYSGKLNLAKSELAKRGETFQFNYVVSEVPGKGKGSKQKKEDDEQENMEKTSEQRMEEEERDLKISWITRFQILPTILFDNHGKLNLHDKLVQQWKNHIPFHIAKLTALDEADDHMEKLEEIISVSDEVISKIDVRSLSSNLGLKFDPRPDASAIQVDTEKQISWLITALVKKGCALADRIIQRKNKVGEREQRSPPTYRYRRDVWSPPNDSSQRHEQWSPPPDSTIERQEWSPTTEYAGHRRDQKSPPVDFTRPRREQMSPPIDVTRPRRQQLSPLTDSTRQRHEQMSPPIDFTRPRREQLSPLVDSTGQRREQMSPPTDSTRQRQEQMSPPIDFTRPRREQLSPLVDSTGQRREQMSPPTDSTRQRREQMSPPTDSTRQRREQMSPPTDATGQRRQQMSPPIDFTRPRREQMSPPIDITRPRREQLSPLIDSTGQRREQWSPPTDSTGQRREQWSPPADSTRQRREQMSPPIDFTRPRREQLSPLTDSTGQRHEQWSPPTDSTGQRREQWSPTNDSIIQRHEQWSPPTDSTRPRREQMSPTIDSTGLKREQWSTPTDSTRPRREQMFFPTDSTRARRGQQSPPPGFSRPGREQRSPPPSYPRPGREQQFPPPSASPGRRSEQHLPPPSSSGPRGEQQLPPTSSRRRKHEQHSPPTISSEHRFEQQPIGPVVPWRNRNVYLSESLMSLLDFELELEIENLYETYQQLLMYVDVWDSKVLYFMCRFGEATDHFGIALKAAMKLQEDKATKENEAICIHICRELQWGHVAEYLISWLPVKFPSAYATF